MSEEPALRGYAIGALVGKGASSDVFAARDPGGALVAVKILRADLAADPAVRASFLEEAALLAAVQDRRIVAFHELAWTEHGAPALVSELVRGTSLARLLARSLRDPARLDARRRIAPLIAAEIARAAAVLHRASAADGTPLRIVHRDLAPSNVLASLDGEVKLADLGIARAASREARTRSGAVRGTLPYIAPEQIRRAPLDARTDVYQLGALTYELATGRPLYDGRNVVAFVDAVLHRPAPRLGDEHARLRPIVERALAKQQVDRFPDADAMAEALESAATTDPDEARRTLAQLVRAVAHG